MNYQEFIDQLKELLAGSVEGSCVETHTVTRNNNQNYDVFIIHSPNSNLSPTIYLNRYYKDYLDGKTLEDVRDDILEFYSTYQVNKKFDTSCFTDFDKVKNHIVYRLVNYSYNQDLLKNIPHKKFLDFAIIYYCIIDMDSSQFANILIYNNHLSYWGIDSDMLYQLALSNTPKIFPIKMDDMASFLLSNFGDQLLGNLNFAYPMYLLTNEKKLYGATSILYPNLLNNLSNHFHKDMIIIPSSVHEVLLIPTEEVPSSDFFTTMITQVNETEISAEEILSDHAYLYQQETNELVIL